MNTKIEIALLEQIKEEFYSAYLYLSMSAWAESNGFKGAGIWLRVQFQEEMAHALHFFDYLKDRGGKITLPSIVEPPSNWKDIIALYQDVKTHEQDVTTRINNVYSIAIEEKDHATSTFLQWFITEQVEEEKNVQDILDQLKMIGANGSGLYLLDKELATRVFVQPTFGTVA